MGRPPVGTCGRLAAAPQLPLIEAFTAEAHVMPTPTICEDLRLGSYY